MSSSLSPKKLIDLLSICIFYCLTFQLVLNRDKEEGHHLLKYIKNPNNIIILNVYIGYKTHSNLRNIKWLGVRVFESRKQDVSL